eukprot:Blabericola_migrator_1__5093@NODE_2635_length_2507_cov_6_290164_g1653_i0_p3_GENE_NODE_2635_length_2507_cov_6_290164_g1653_i0NODE_2635_length_2507_cov_6_290164_g1653_i0_p3_ORF_typecomplete_len147_score23_09_NODE_2635_length_2507_cov_6_290164_g1653_i066506
MSAEYHRLVGTIRIHDLTGVTPPIKASSVVLDLVKGNFMDAMVYCLWQMQIQLEIRNIRLKRITNIIALRQQSSEKRRDASRARATATLFGAESPEQREGSTRDSAPLLFDPAPTRARLSKALAAPIISRPAPKRPTSNRLEVPDL